jgi:Arc/MetJ-type ribon-helix-helix transcriptional regulator
MKAILVELPDATATELERVAPGRARKRSAFIREAVRRALDALAEKQMARAYREQPDTEPTYLDAAAWEPRPKRRRGRR